ncbi:hypothetical protein DLAC_03768 [Tieghemostelium lacteum]|uniref:Ribosomal protein L7Ae/L30e/S12e/Gadd45 domain-containing protein n=1 Tax=Tieghemostelium lacteum TaxID=361077 RepID=A0A152A0U0_TIELA|nr:hypothetical protein DLAC_03768 [Tieghemostelium lacteum]|eukprot:KYQ99818.1 hypothetical protein DLAC_03768 [Tieghemostelium lacteum]
MSTTPIPKTKKPLGKHSKNDTLKSMEKEKLANKKPAQSVIKKKRVVLFKDTVSTPYLQKELQPISKEYSDDIIKLLSDFLQHDRERIKEKNLKQTNQYEKIKNETSVYRKTNKKLVSIKRKQNHIKSNKEQLSPDQVEKSLNNAIQTEKDLQKQVDQMKLQIEKQKETYQEQKKSSTKDTDTKSQLPQFWIGVNKITREMEKTAIDAKPSIKLILVCPNPDLPILTNHLVIMAFLRRIPICLLGKSYRLPFSECFGLPNSTLAVAIKDSNSNSDMDVDSEYDNLIKIVNLGITASRSVPSIDYPWLPSSLSGSNLTQPLDIKYKPVNMFKQENKRSKLNK